jgi:hypothetical protein
MKHLSVHFLCLVTVALATFQMVTCMHVESIVDAVDQRDAKCTEERRINVELAVAKVMSFGPHGRPFPDTPENLETYCSEGSKLLYEVESYIRECIPKKIADVTIVIMYSIKGSFVRKYCSPGKKNKKEAVQLMKMAPCINEHLLRDESCIIQFINDTKPLVNIQEDELKIPYTCCNYVKTLQCINGKIDKQTCLQQNRDEIMDIVRGPFAAINDIVCGDYNEFTDRCETIGPAPLPLAPNEKHYDTYLFLLTDVLASTKGFTNGAFRHTKVEQTESVVN